MLGSLYIKNYRNLKELTVNSLGRVNLIIGKNNTGKSTLLEAVAIYATKGDARLIYQLLEERGENTKTLNEISNNSIQTNIKILSSLFSNRIVGFDVTNAISIGNNIEDTQFGEKLSLENNVSLKFVKYVEEESKVIL